MSSMLEELRQRSAQTKAVHEQKVNRVREAVTEVVNSSSFMLSTLNHSDNDSDGTGSVEKFATEVAEKVAAVVTDPKAEFLDTLHARGLKESSIRNAVEKINSIFGLTESEEYDDKLEAVALYLRKNPNLYDDIKVLA